MALSTDTLSTDTPPIDWHSQPWYTDMNKDMQALYDMYQEGEITTDEWEEAYSLEGPQATTCQEQGKIECTNGSCADTLEECGSIYDDYSKDIGYEPEGEFITDKPETSYDDALHDVYLAIGGKEWTGLGFEEWVEKYGDTFPQWEGSEYEAQSELLESQLGLLKPALELKMESYDFQEEQNRWQTTTALEDQSFAREALVRSTGGLGTGHMEEQIKTAYDRVLEGFDYDQEAIDMERENSLIEFEKKKLTYEFDLSTVVSDFQDSMWNLIAANKELQSMDVPLDYSDPTLTDAIGTITSQEYDATFDYNNDGFLDVLDMVTFVNEGGTEPTGFATEGDFSSKHTDNQWNIGDVTYEIDTVYGYYTYWEMGADGEWHHAGDESKDSEIREGSIEMPEGAFVIECSGYDKDC